MAETDPKTMQDLTLVVQTLLQQIIDDMSSPIDDLERNITDLMIQAGVEELEGENKIPATRKS
uniref:Heat shock factor-binding protein 1 n=1 Tax=Microcebus murinus TaxID=30608 RepID=A0A8C5UUR9_MICMU